MKKMKPTDQERETFHQPTPLTAADILTPEQLAKLLQVHPRWVYEKTRARCQKPLPALRIGRFLRFRLSDIENWLESLSEGKAA